MKNAIFQYMVVNDKVDERGMIKDRKRGELYLEVAEHSRRSFEQYALTIGADHHYADTLEFVKSDDSTALLFECLRVIYDPMFDQYDKVLFADTDIMVNTDEDIFDLCEEGEVFGVLESDYVTSTGGGYNSWDYKKQNLADFSAKYQYHDIPVVPVFAPNKPSKITILNTGMVIWTKEARLRARELFMDWEEWFFAPEEAQYHMSIMNDQPYISGQLMQHDFDLVTIPQTWNDSPHYVTEKVFFETAKMCHYTGGEWKLDMLRHIEEGRFSQYYKQ